MRHSLVHYGRAVQTEQRGAAVKRNRVKAGLVFFDEDGQRLISLDPIEVAKRLENRDGTGCSDDN